ncbi:MAG TPA: response regulator [Gemmatimonadales bacterium]|nr:response regulator [Gemmatimonadales bacterium]
MATILIVEDSPDNMVLFRTVLALKGHTVIEQVDGHGLLQAIDDAHPDLVLMDIQLPDKDGYTLLQELRDSGRRTLRVVALTAHAMGSDRERAREAGFDGYITKPIDVRSFPGLIERALAGETVEA